VKLVQDKAKKLIKEEYKLIIIGKAEHPEVIGIKAHADYEAGKERTVVISSPEEALQLKDFTKNAKIGVVVQTTQKTENFKNILPILAENSKELRVYNTICHTPRHRQKEAEDLATQADLMIVVGGRTSANTTHLAEILGYLHKQSHRNRF
jgi:4-hydroxy-3-methylbut-2-enyl diphosphate reductase